MSNTLLSLHNVTFAWPKQPVLLDIPAFHINVGEHVFLAGPSGCGKTTLLSLLGAVQRPISGDIRLLDNNLSRLSRGQRDRFRVDHIGFLFQQFNLLPFLPVLENIQLPCHFATRRAERAKARYGSVENAARSLLQRLGLDPALAHRRADELSIGQQQRVAAARALIGQPELIIADEPTSALDTQNREGFLQLLFEECRAADAGLLFVSHDLTLTSLFDRQLSLPEINRATHWEGNA